MFQRYREEHPDLAEQVAAINARALPAGWEAALPVFPPNATGLSTRDASGQVLNAVAKRVPWIIGGAADLAPSTKTRLTFDAAGDFEAAGPLGAYTGRNMHFGVREHAMCAAVNGMTLCGLRAFGSGFLIFTDYARGAIRLASLMELPVLHIWTHDSISVGEDGPTHDPRHGGHPSGRCQRDVRGVSLRPAANQPAGGADLFTAGTADRRPHKVRAGLRAGKGRLCADRRSFRQA
jgi:transketolase